VRDSVVRAEDGGGLPAAARSWVVTLWRASPSVRGMRIANILPLFTLTLGACAVGTDDTDGAEAFVIASVDRPSGSHVEFLATEEGGVIVAEEWQLDSQPTLPADVARSVDPRDYYRALTGEEAPDDLAALVEASAIPYRRFSPAELALEDGPRPSSTFWTVTAAEFKAAICGRDYADNVQEWCHTDQTVETKHKKDDINGLTATVCTVSGEVELRIALRPHGDWQRKSYMVSAGRCTQVAHTSYTDFDGEAWVMQVGSGDKYHHGGMRCWNTWGLQCWIVTPPPPT
jgi:hypothetical protein